MTEHPPVGRAVTIAIVDNDAWTLRALGGFLQRAPADCRVLWTALSAEQTLDRLARHRPDILLTDMSLGQFDGVRLVRTIRLRDAHTGIIAMTSFLLEDYAGPAAEAGAQALIGKNKPANIIHMIHTVAEGGTGCSVNGYTFRTPSEAFREMSQYAGNGVDELTDKERALIELCARGMTSMQIAAETGLAVSTVNNRFQRICDKLQASNRMQMVSRYLTASRPVH